MIKETYNPHQAPKVGDYVKISDPTLPPDFTCRVARAVFIDKVTKRYLVEFVESHPKLHDGMVRDAKCKNHHGWWVGLEEMAPLKVDAMFMNDGDTIYCQRSDKRRITGTATCSKLDEYDPLTGAMIAFARAYGADPTTAAYRVLKAFSKTPADLRLTHESTGDPFGTPGDPTPYKDNFGTPLCVGDVVFIKHRTERGWHEEPNIVVETPEDGPFIMGLQCVCDPKTGEIDRWDVRWGRSWKELEPGQEYGVIRVVEAPQVPTAKPKKKHLVFRGGPKDKHMFYGALGADTDLVDSFGVHLHVGDVVSVLHRNRGFISDDPIVECMDGRPFVMGLAGQRFTKDRRNPDWQIVKARPYTDLLIGEKFSDNWLVVKEEEIDE